MYISSQCLLSSIVCIICIRQAGLDDVCFTKQQTRSLKQTLMQYSCHEFGILGIQQLSLQHYPTPPPPLSTSRQTGGGWVLEWVEGSKEKKRGVRFWKKQKQNKKKHCLHLFWHVCGCFHGDGSKDSRVVSEIQCAEWC